MHYKLAIDSGQRNSSELREVIRELLHQAKPTQSAPTITGKTNSGKLSADTFNDYVVDVGKISRKILLHQLILIWIRIKVFASFFYFSNVSERS